jgi:hypothetical protein
MSEYGYYFVHSSSYAVKCQSNDILIRGQWELEKLYNFFELKIGVLIWMGVLIIVNIILTKWDKKLR